MGVVVDVEPPRLVFVFSSIINTYARAGTNRPRVDVSIFNPKRCAEQVLTIQALVNRHRSAKLAGTARDVRFTLWIVSKMAHQLHIIQRLDRAAP